MAPQTHLNRDLRPADHSPAGISQARTTLSLLQQRSVANESTTPSTSTMVNEQISRFLKICNV